MAQKFCMSYVGWIGILIKIMKVSEYFCIHNSFSDNHIMYFSIPSIYIGVPTGGVLKTVISRKSLTVTSVLFQYSDEKLCGE